MFAGSDSILRVECLPVRLLNEQTDGNGKGLQRMRDPVSSSPERLFLYRMLLVVRPPNEYKNSEI